MVLHLPQGGRVSGHGWLVGLAVRGRPGAPPIVDPRRNPQHLYNFLMGGEDWGRGLLHRVQRAATRPVALGVPGYAGGWYIASGRPSGEGVYHDADDVLRLCLNLIGWVENLILDDEALGVAVDELAGRIEQSGTSVKSYLDAQMDRVRTRVNQTLAKEHVLDRDRSDALALIVYLKGWLGTHCEHSFRVLNGHDGIDWVRCDKCGLGEPDPDYKRDLRLPRNRFHPEFPMARCEVCGDAMPRAKEGRTRLTCSDACRQRKARSA